jgi:6-phosphofructokinase 1
VKRSRIRRISVGTAGGDAPGLNAVIRAVVRCAEPLGWEVYGIERGYDGILSLKGVRRLTRADVRGLLGLGGTILGATTSGNPFKYPVTLKGRAVERDLSGRLLANFRRLGIDAHVAIGGDGSLSIAEALYRKGLKVVGVPKTIDNDLAGTETTFGFDTAVSTAAEGLDRLRTTAASHQRVMVVEVMGRDAGWIALHAGIAGGADVILIPEIPFTVESVCRAVEARYRSGRGFCVIVAAEGAAPRSGTQAVLAPAGLGGRPVRVGGIAESLAREIEERTGRPSRSVVLGHLQRGGSPTPLDRLLATRFGAAAVRFIQESRFGRMVALDPPNIVAVPLSRIAARQKKVPAGCDTVLAARALGLSFGDEKTS